MTRIVSGKGENIMAINPNTDFSSGAVLTAAQQNRFPRGVMGYQNYTGGSFTATTTPALITGISITFTGVANRLYRAIFTGECQSVTSAHRTTAIIRNGATSVVEGVTYAGAGDYSQLTVIALFTATGSTTVTVQATAQANTSVILGVASPNSMTFIVEDVGAI